MHTVSASTSEPSHGTSATALNRLTYLYAWAESFVLLGIQLFWASAKSYPLATESWWSASALVAPLGVVLVLGLLASIPAIRKALIRIEPGLHWLASASLVALIALVVTYDPLDMLVPFTLPLFVWSGATSLVLAANLVRHLAYRQTESMSDGWRWSTVVSAVVVWGGVLCIVATMGVLVWCWVVSAFAHAILAPTSVRLYSTVTRDRGPRVLDGLVAVFETMALALILFVVLSGTPTSQPILGAPELKHLEVFQWFVSPWFLLGASAAALSRQLRIQWLTHIAAAAVAGIIPNTYPFVGPLLAGYAIVAMPMAVTRAGAFGFALTLVVSAAVWMLVMALCSVSALLASEPITMALSGPILANARWVMLGLLVLGALAALIQRFRSARNGILIMAFAAPSPVLSGFVLVVVASLAVAAPLAISMQRPAASVRIQRAERVSVGTPAGLCHAGYSHSDDEYADLAKLGAGMVRIDFRWNSIQSNPDTWDFQRYDDFVDAANAHGVKVLALLNFDNNAVEQSSNGKERDSYIAPEDVPLFLEYVRRTVAHFKDRVYAWETWNEPSLGRFWVGTDREMYDLVKGTADTIYGIGPEIRVVGSAMHSALGIWTPHQIEGLYQSGAMERVDYPNMHLYIGDPRGYGNEFAKIVAMKDNYNHPGSIWITELGDPDGGGYPWRVTTEGLVEHVIKSHVAATAYGIGQLVWYCYKDGGQKENPLDSEGFFGLLSPDGRWKPAAYAYSLFNTYCTNSELRSDIVTIPNNLTARQVRTALYRRDNGDSVLVLWYEPTLSGRDTVRVGLDFGDLEDPPVVHDINSDYTKTLYDPTVDVGEKPVFITFRATSPDTPVHIDVHNAVVDTALAVVLVVALVVSACACVVRQKRPDDTARVDVAADTADAGNAFEEIG